MSMRYPTPLEVGADRALLDAWERTEAEMAEATSELPEAPIPPDIDTQREAVDLVVNTGAYVDRLAAIETVEAWRVDALWAMVDATSG